MGKGKAKGWRPPAAGEAANSMLFGSADHLTGDTIASPVQLREEGKKIPEGHVNYGGNWGAPPASGAGKGKGKDTGSTGGSGSGWATSTSAPHSKAPSSSGSAEKNNGYCAPSAKASSSGPKANPFAPAAAAEPAASSIAPAVPKFAEDTQKAPAGMTEIERRRAARLAASNAAGATSDAAAPAAAEPQDGKTEIERRREARAKAQMLEQQRLALAASEVQDDADGLAVKVAEEEEGMTEIERRRRAREAEKRQREEADEKRDSTAKTEIERRRETMLQLERALALETAASDSSAAPPGEEEDGFETRRRALEARRLQAEKVAREAEARRREASQASPGLSASAASAVGEEAAVKSEDQLPMDGLEEEQPAEMEAEAAMELKEEDDGELAEPPVKRQTCAAPGAMQQGLQSWVDRMNALAEGDEALLKRCREFVRKRILQAHADGNVHTNNWADEPLPSLSEL